MTRTTQAELDAMGGRAVRAAMAAGLDVTGWRFELHGSKANGISYKLDAHNVPLGGWGRNYLGMTAGEAYHTLHTLALAWEAVASARAEQDA